MAPVRRVSRPVILCAANAAAARRVLCVLVIGLTVAPFVRAIGHATTDAGSPPGVAVLLYHRFGPSASDAMTVRTATFRSQLEYLAQHDRPVVPLGRVVDWLQGRTAAPPPNAVCITVDDGHASVFHEMLPAVREYGVPVTLFVYPSAISNASYAMTWPELRALSGTGLFDIQSHTFWHPRFDVERRRLSPAEWEVFVARQLERPRIVIAERVETPARLLAWPFGIYDADLMTRASQAGYVAAFTMDRRVLTRGDPIMALPRLLVTDADVGPRFASLLPRRQP